MSGTTPSTASSTSTAAYTAAAAAHAEATNKAAEEPRTLMDAVLDVLQDNMLGTRSSAKLTKKVTVPVAEQQKRVGTALKNLQHLFTSKRAQFDHFKFLPVEQLIQIGLMQLVLTVFKKNKTIGKEHYEAVAALFHVLRREAWQDIDYTDLIKPFQKLAPQWFKSGQKDLQQLFNLMQLTECYQYRLQSSPVPPRAKTAVEGFVAEINAAFSEVVFPLCNAIIQSHLIFVHRLNKAEDVAYRRQSAASSTKAYTTGTVELVEEYAQSFKWLHYYGTSMMVRFESNYRKPLSDIPNRREHLQALSDLGSDFGHGWRSQVVFLHKKCSEFSNFIALKTGNPLSPSAKKFLLDFYQKMMVNVSRVFLNLQKGCETIQEDRWQAINAQNAKVDTKRLAALLQVIGLTTAAIGLEWHTKTLEQPSKEIADAENKLITAQKVFMKEIQTGTSQIDSDLDSIKQITRRCLEQFKQAYEELVAKQYRAIPFMGIYNPEVHMRGDCHVRTWLIRMTEYFGRLAGCVTYEKTVHHFQDLTMHQAFDKILNEGADLCTNKVMDLKEYDVIMAQFHNFRKPVIVSDAFAQDAVRMAIDTLEVVAAQQTLIADAIDILRFQTQILLACQPSEGETKAADDQLREDYWLAAVDDPEALSIDTEAERIHEWLLIRQKEAEATKGTSKPTIDAVSVQIDKVVQVAASAITASVSAMTTSAKPVPYQPYTHPTVQLLAQHRHQLKCFYRVPQLAMTPFEMVGKGPDFLEFSKRQQVFWTDQLQWSYEMLLNATSPDEQEVLASFYLFCLQLSTEQTVSGVALSLDPENTLTHRVHELHKKLGGFANKHVLKNNTKGTVPFRFPNSTTGSDSLVLTHERTPSAATVTKILKLSDPMIRSFIDVAARAATSVSTIDKSVDSGATVQATAALAQATAASATALPLPPSSAMGVAATAAGTSTPAEMSRLTSLQVGKLQRLSEEMINRSTALNTYIEACQKNASVSMAKINMLIDVRTKLRKLSVLPRVIFKQADERYLSSQVIMCCFWSQYAAINLGRFLRPETVKRDKLKDIETFRDSCGLGAQLDPDLKPIFNALNVRKGWEYIVEYFAMHPRSKVSRLMLYTNHTYGTAALLTAAHEANEKPTSQTMPLIGMYDEFIDQYLEPVYKTVMQLVTQHVPKPK